MIKIDEQGFPLIGEVRITDPLIGKEILTSLSKNETGAYQAALQNQVHLVEAFDEPFVAQSISLLNETNGVIHLPFFVDKTFKLDDLSVDEWDRFHGVITTENGEIPFVLSREAQSEFFDQVDEFDDDSFTWKGKKFEVSIFLVSNPEIETAKYWSDLYKEKPGWEMDAPSPVLFNFLPRMKLPKSRVLVLGCGSGNDAALFAEKGHEVTAVDFSEKALQQAQEKYKHLSIKWEQKDVFNLPRDWDEKFDLVFEHTCYCAIRPEKRKDLLKVWRRVIHDQGFLLGIFFANSRREGPPFGSTEWEIRERLKNDFKNLIWFRPPDSHPRRVGRELLCLAQKKDGAFLKPLRPSGSRFMDSVNRGIKDAEIGKLLDSEQTKKRLGLKK